MTKTGGTTGTNQYKVRGQARRREITPTMAPWHKLVEEADTPDPDGLAWELLAQYGNREALAKATGLPAPVLAILVQDDDPRIRRNVASNPGCTPPILATLVVDNDLFVRQTAVNNPNCTSKVLDDAYEYETLHPKYGVIPSIVRHPNCPVQLLMLHLNSGEYEMRTLVAGHRSSPPQMLESMVKDGSASVRQALAGNPNTPAAALARLAGDKKPVVRQTVATNSACPDHVRTIVSLGR